MSERPESEGRALTDYDIEKLLKAAQFGAAPGFYYVADTPGFGTMLALFPIVPVEAAFLPIYYSRGLSEAGSEARHIESIDRCRFPERARDRRRAATGVPSRTPAFGTYPGFSQPVVGSGAD